MSDPCIFCQIVAGQMPATKVYETDDLLAFRDIHPAAPTHILIIPKKHITGVSSLEEADAALMGQMIYTAKLVADQEGLSKGYRLVINNGKEGGQHIYHIHLHLIGGRRLSWPPG